MSLAKLETQPTKANTPFDKWWPLLNAQLFWRGLPDAGFSTAHGLWETGHCPRTGAAEVEATS